MLLEAYELIDYDLERLDTAHEHTEPEAMELLLDALELMFSERSKELVDAADAFGEFAAASCGLDEDVLGELFG